LKGKTNLFKNGYVKIGAVYSDYHLYDFTAKNDSVLVSNGNFTFKGNLSYPQLVYLKFTDNNFKSIYVEDFFIDKGKHFVLIDTSIKTHNIFIPFSQGVQMKKSSINQEYFNEYLVLFKTLDEKVNLTLNNSSSSNFIKQRDSFRLVRDSIVLNYSLSHRNSEILPWMVYSLLMKYGYKEIYQQVISNVSWKNQKLKNGILNVLNSKRDIVIGKFLPYKDRLINPSFQKDTSIKYILVDFWFSNCNPCLKQFEELRATYSKYEEFGFKIVAVSIDDETKKEYYQNLLAKKGYPWHQELDLGGEIAKQLYIDKYPTNFLIDNKGRIIKIDIEPKQLNKFLSEHCSK